MSMPNISDINPIINLSRNDAVNLTMASIAMEELALAHIINAEGEKLQYVLGTLEGRDPGEVTICDVMAVNDSINRTLRNVIKEEMLLQLKLEDVVELAGGNADEDSCQLTIIGRKIWRDGGNIDGTRPANVRVNLLRDGVVFRNTLVDSAGDGSFTFACLPMWRDAETQYEYTVAEDAVPDGYSSEVSGYNITNTVIPGSVTITGSKVWDDNDDAAGERPETITVNLLQNGVLHLSQQVTTPDGENSVDFSFTGVERFDGEGNPYTYTVDEEAIPNYTGSVADNIITNQYNL